MIMDINLILKIFNNHNFEQMIKMQQDKNQKLLMEDENQLSLSYTMLKKSYEQ